MSDFFTEYFLNPLLANGWFNPINTAAWGIVLVVAAFLVYTRLLKRMKIKVDRHFALAILPFVFWASSTRVLRDIAYGLALRASAGDPTFLTDIVHQTIIIQQQAFLYISVFLPVPGLASMFSWVIALFETPGSYVFTFLFALACLLLGLGIQRISSGRRWPRRLPSRIPYWKFMFIIGLIACAINAVMIPWGANPLGMGLILGITGAFSAVFFGLTYLKEKKIVKFKPLEIFSRTNSTLLSVHMLDSSATFVSVMFFGYYEQHPVPRLFIDAIGPWTFFILKLVVLLPSLWIIDKYAEEGEFRNFLKIVILILGLAPGLRDMIRLGAGV